MTNHLKIMRMRVRKHKMGRASLVAMMARHPMGARNPEFKNVIDAMNKEARMLEIDIRAMKLSHRALKRLLEDAK